ncbi:hypothetical protein CEE37_13020 [candidate division LCP-89 bacterium B3_LCP]|uniref:Uncharacterized protein n=1 Tax=candidate division LCP-89 bacterium B3_LCP TaxID=2012998 RepID=A0A532UU16_UNCL8|nr:MAG: hypothetical protein CEE37_13020 [candidate division LCP-89 bacterium B3_LCP]
MDTKEIAKLVTFIEENLRASQIAGLSFVDARHFRTRLLSGQNHVVFGRRGAGKTSLVQAIKNTNKHIYVYLNLEDYKDITFPNIVIHVLVELFNSLKEQIRMSIRFWRFRPKVIRVTYRIYQTVKGLKQYIHEPDQETIDVKTTKNENLLLSVSAQRSSMAAGAKGQIGKSKEIIRKLPKNKIDYLRLKLTGYKSLLINIKEIFNDAHIYLVLDDFYFVDKNSQPELVDYFHRITKGTDLFLKLATIKYRTKLYRRPEDKIIGVEIGHDIFEIDMDYTLDNSEELQAFMHQLLSNAIEKSCAHVDIDKMFSGDGFPQLCLASGGVPRDFLWLFVKLANNIVSSDGLIGKTQVNESAIANLGNKLESMKRDSGDEDVILEDYLKRIKRYVYDEKRTNTFLIAKDDLESDDQGRQAIRELVDLRILHLVDHNTSKAPSDGRRYEAYMLDISLYDNARPRKFNQVEPGQTDEKARKDLLRASPLILFDKLREPISVEPSQTTDKVQKDSPQTSSSNSYDKPRKPTSEELQGQLSLSYE